MKINFKHLGFILLGIVLISVLLFIKLNNESSIFKRNVMSNAKSFYHHKNEHYWDEDIIVEGAWNTTYKNSVRIDCVKDKKQCLLVQASLYTNSDILDVYKEEFEIEVWNNDYIKAYDENTQYRLELNINLKNRDVIYTKHPLKKTGDLGNELVTETFQLYDGWKVDMNINENIVKNAKWWQAPLTKIIYLIFPLKDELKIKLL